MKVLGRIIGVLLLILVIATGCKHQETKAELLQKVTSSKAVWYLYNQKGTKEVLSLQFQKDGTVIVKEVDGIGAPGGENRVDANFANPAYQKKAKHKQITIQTATPKMVIQLGATYKATLNHKKMAGYEVTYNEHKNWRLAQIKEDGSDNGGTSLQSTTKQKKKVAKQPAQLEARLLNFVHDPKKGATPLGNPEDAGNYIYRTLAGKNQAYGQLTLNGDGTYQNSVSVHAIQGTKDSDEDKPVVADYEVQTGHVTTAYGKYYLVPDNLLRVSYGIHGQNPKNPLPQKIALYTGKNIGLSTARIEHNGDDYQFYSKDYEPWPDNGATGVTTTTLTKTEDTQIALDEVYRAAVKQYYGWQEKTIQSNEDFMQVVAAVADNHQNKIDTLGVNFSGSYGITQQPTDYPGVAKDGSKQALMNYVFAVSPSNSTSGTAVITTSSGSLLVFGSLKNQLYVLHQPDADSATVTWKPIRDVPLKIPPLKVRLNP